jgi:hypothetical protein
MAEISPINLTTTGIRMVYERENVVIPFICGRWNLYFQKGLVELIRFNGGKKHGKPPK